MTRPFFKLALALAALAFLMAACAQPTLIASYPKAAAYTPAPPPPGNAVFVYNSTLNLEVSDPEWASQEAIRRAYSAGGYLVSSQAYTYNNRRCIALELAVPPYSFDRLRNNLLSLGRLDGETTSGNWISQTYGNPPAYGRISLRLSQAAGYTAPPLLPSASSGWSPAGTLRQAFRVFVSIFGFLADVIIWIVVVAGPFVLLALLGRWAYRRWRRNTPRPD